MNDIAPVEQIDTSAAFFESLYLRSRDPWGFETKDYELRRYYLLLKMLKGKRFNNAFEPGCSVGVLTELLAPYCAHLTAIDAAPTAIRHAQARCKKFSHVVLRQGMIPEDIPSDSFDLIVFSELGYYFERDELAAVIDRLLAVMSPAATLLSCHWLGTSADHRLSGKAVHSILETRLGESEQIVMSGDKLDQYEIALWQINAP